VGVGLGLGLCIGLGLGLFGALFGGLFAAGLIAAGPASDREISCVGTVGWPWTRIWGTRFNALEVGLIGALFGGLLAAAAAKGGLVFGLLGALVGGLVSGLVYVLVFGLGPGLTTGEIETRDLPNEGIHRSARNALVFGLAAGLVFGLVFGLGPGLTAGQVGGLVGALSFGLGFGLAAGLCFGLAIGLKAGGEACLRHVVLRVLLIRNGSTPWNYVRFLDYAAQRIFLRKVGGGYAFIHRMLLEHFAARYVEPSLGDAQPPSPLSTKHKMRTA
jgi:hypothetical protein